MSLGSELARAFRTLRAPTTHWTTKALAIGSLLYLVLPVDLIPDLVPVLGLGDDAALLLVAVLRILAEIRRARDAAPQSPHQARPGRAPAPPPLPPAPPA